MKTAELVEHLRNHGWNDNTSPQEGVYGDIELVEVYADRGVGGGDYDGYEIVYQVGDQFFMVEGYYSSQEGCDWYNVLDTMREVRQEEVVKTEWVSVAQ